MRIENLQKILPEHTAALVTSGDNRFYLTHMRSSAGVVLVTREQAYLIIDFRYIEKAKKTACCEVLLMENTSEQLKELANKHGVTDLLVEVDEMSVETFGGYKKSLSPLTLSDSPLLSDTLRRLRSIKSPEELKLICDAQKLTDDTFTYILDRIQPGRTEKDVMLDMEFYMRRLGSEGVSFDFIVVSGKNSSLPHGVPGDRPIEKGDFVTMDFGAVCGGYRSDMTRTVAVGSVSDEQRTVYNTVLKAQLAAIQAMKAGEICCDMDKVARDIIYGAGYEGCFGHGLGHSVGIAIHEMPVCNPRCSEKLESGMIMTVEPGIYLENKFGVRIEDMVFIREDGCDVLTKSEKNLIVL